MRYPLAVVLFIAAVGFFWWYAEVFHESTPSRTASATSQAGASQDTLRFATIGDFGDPYQGTFDVAALIRSWSPDLIITLGDNNYPDGEAETIDENIGQHYRTFIGNYVGTYGPGAEVNRFFPTLGNHDYYTPGAQPYFDYFTLPGNERYYEFVWGPVHFFALNSNPQEPDGMTASSAQAQWLQAAMAASTAPWQVVYFHHPPYASSERGPTVAMRWPFKEWGADAVLASHDHIYERLDVDGLLYTINGLGGRSRYALGSPVPESRFQYNVDYGAQRVTATACSLTFEFVNLDGIVVDSYTMDQCGGTVASHDDGVCYLVADNDGVGGQDVLTRIDPGTGQEVVVGPTGTWLVEAMALDPDAGTLYLMDGDDLGTVDPETGVYTEVGDAGYGDGPLGFLSFDDLDGLAFDPRNGTLYASVRRSGQDLLVQIHPGTGGAIDHAFGTGVDYLTVQPVAGLDDLDDIAFAPDGTLYAVLNADDGTAHLATLDPATGATALVAVLDVQNVEGLTFAADGTLLGSLGSSGKQLVAIDPNTGITTPRTALGTDGYRDYEALACAGSGQPPPPDPNHLTGTAFADTDADGQHDPTEGGLPGMVVSLHDGSGAFRESQQTDADGHYAFVLEETGTFTVVLEPIDLPAGTTITTPTSHSVTFDANGLTRSGNDFGLYEAPAGTEEVCYLVADNDGQGGVDVLTRVDKVTLAETIVGPTGTSLIEAVAFSPFDGTLYAADAKTLGTLDRATGLYTQIGFFGRGDGAVGNQSFRDVDGLTFDPNTGVFFGTVRKVGREDLLIHIDPATGDAVPDAFGVGEDYRVITAVNGSFDVDDIAIDPTDGSLYAVQNEDDNSYLITIDKATGAAQSVAPMNVRNVEGLTFDGEGTLLGVLGSSGNEIVAIDKATGTATAFAAVGTAGDRDYESIDCLTNTPNAITLLVFEDADGDGRYTRGDQPAADIPVALYRDVNGNGVLDAPDLRLHLAYTDGEGSYRFQTVSQGTFVLSLADLPSGTVVTTHSPTTARFEGFGGEDADNIVGYHTATATTTEGVEVPREVVLEKNYPNPFNPQTTIAFALPEAGLVRLAVYDLLGREVARLADGSFPAGHHTVTFDAYNLPSGPYLYRLETPKKAVSRTMLLVK